MRQAREVLRLHYDVGLSHREIARALGLTHPTVGQCLARFRAAGGTWPLAEDLTDTQLQAWLYPGNTGRPHRRPEPEWPRLHQELRQHRHLTLELLWLEYKAAHPDGLQYTQFCAHYRSYVRSLAVVWRRIYRPGDQMHVDFAGDTLPLYDPRTGAVAQRAALFVAVLPYSNFTFVGVYPDQTLASWVRGHVEAVTAFGGVPRLVVPDNPRPLVSDTRGDVVLHPTYQDLGNHYHLGIVPARVRKPRDKAKVEGAVLLVERWVLMALRHARLPHLAAAQQQVQALVDRLNDRPFQKQPGTRRTLFLTEERATLQPLPAQSYVLAEWRTATVSPDYHIHVEKSAYSVPQGLVGQRVAVRLTALTVECFVEHPRVASHPRAARPGTWSTRLEHLPPHHQAMQKGWSPEYFTQQAQQIGPQTATLVTTILERAVVPEQVYTRCRGLLRLAQEFSPAVLEQAAARAVPAEIFTVKAVRTFCQQATVPPAPPRAAHHNTRGAAYYQAPLPPTPEGGTPS
jgi:transposase